MSAERKTHVCRRFAKAPVSPEADMRDPARAMPAAMRNRSQAQVMFLTARHAGFDATQQLALGWAPLLLPRGSGTLAMCSRA